MKKNNKRNYKRAPIASYNNLDKKTKTNEVSSNYTKRNKLLENKISNYIQSIHFPPPRLFTFILPSVITPNLIISYRHLPLLPSH